ncbi:hypothetical protein [Putridiphycobacter roseus]|uniref:hypothetical protein n=1 Tax=Putridiphycobacter roseus TaxID=2219161 RepID=UPI001F26015B|nr:hypothetical protein [Putridiphycobacter roseus]
MRQLRKCIIPTLLFFTIISCNKDKTDDYAVIVEVKAANFLANGDTFTITTEEKTLSNGNTAECYKIVTNGVPSDHEMGPWCPDNITDGAEAGGIWLENGEVYDVDGAFIENLATFYNDNKWLMYDGSGNIYKTETEDDCANAANPDVGVEYENFCVECLPSYVTSISNTYYIPVTPQKAEEPISFGGFGPPGVSSAPSQRGIAFNGEYLMHPHRQMPF